MIGLDWNPSSRTLRQFAAIAFFVLAGAAALAHLRGKGWLAQALPLAVGTLAGLSAWLRPQALRLTFVLLSLAAYPIGFVLSHVVLLILFYGVITPLGALARLAGSDPLALKREQGLPSYWRERRRPREKASYLRQA